jgi:hypothetical protein
MSSEPEWQTPKMRVDADPSAQGRSVAPFQPGRSHHRHAVAEFPTGNGPAECALVVGNRGLGIAIWSNAWPLRLRRRSPICCP